MTSIKSEAKEVTCSGQLRQCFFGGIPQRWGLLEESQSFLPHWKVSVEAEELALNFSPFSSSNQREVILGWAGVEPSLLYSLFV